MSHYTVAVIHDKNESVDELLAPYQENSEENAYVEFSVEIEAGKEKEFRADTMKSKAIKKMKKEEKDKWIAKSDEEFIKHWTGYEKNEDGNWGYEYNPDARWDWYSIGGRWKDMLKLKAGKQGKNGEASWFDEKYKQKEGWCDSAKIDDIDFEGIENYNTERAKKSYAKSREIIAEMKKKFKNKTEINSTLTWEYDTSIDETLEKHIKKQKGFSTYAVLADGEWHEAGKMGWWGISNASDKAEKNWYKSYQQFLDTFDKNKIITIVDCHI